MFKWLSGTKAPKGYIAYYDLGDWWESEFSDDERDFMVEQYQPMGGELGSLINGSIGRSSQSVVAFLSGLSGWFKKKENCHLAQRIVLKAENLAGDRAPVLDRHFLYLAKIEAFYPDRQNEVSYEQAVNACRDQIGLSKQAARAFKKEYGDDILPSHTGYKQLAIVLEREKRFQEVIELCAQAKKEGWSGDWDKRIARCKGKAGKLK